MTSTEGLDPKEIVRRGYDLISYDYREDDPDGEGVYGSWIDHLCEQVPEGGSILDLGCGCGVPVSRRLAANGFAVTGVDISAVQIERARKLVPTGTFLHGDATAMTFPSDSFDAVVSFFAIIHIPVDEQQALFTRIGRWLRPGGLLVATVGHRAWTGTEESWHGAPMWWSHADADTYRGWITAAGLDITAEHFVPEGDGGHALFTAVRR
ncbi:MAG TPA: class I SAM-dependent methyltransferase [Actinopolymorphaceae bacterium]